MVVHGEVDLTMTGEQSHEPGRTRLNRMSLYRRFAMRFAAILVIGIAAAPTANAQSFNCRNAASPDEMLICQDTNLSRLDERMAGLYFAIRNGAVGDERQAIERSQAAWLAARISCGRDRGCVEQSYQNRIAQLSGYLQNSSPAPNAAETYSSPHASVAP
jgi:uncharacterized protein